LRAVAPGIGQGVVAGGALVLVAPPGFNNVSAAASDAAQRTIGDGVAPLADRRLLDAERFSDASGSPTAMGDEKLFVHTSKTKTSYLVSQRTLSNVVDKLSYMESISDRLRQALDDAEMGPTALAARMKVLEFDVSPEAISQWLSGKTKPNGANIIGAAAALGVYPLWLLKGKGPRSIDKQRERELELAGEIVEMFKARGIPLDRGVEAFRALLLMLGGGVS
jgi:transcriptional regulator with XRE-family HTH domain